MRLTGKRPLSVIALGISLAVAWPARAQPAEPPIEITVEATEPGASQSPAPPPTEEPPPAPQQGTEAGPPPPVDASPVTREPIEVRVLGAPVRRIPGSAHSVSSKTLDRYEYDDPHSAMQLVPGVYVRQEDGMGLRPNIGIRGAIADRSKKVTLLEDGVPFAPAPYSAPAAYYFPVFTRIYQMRVIKGPGALAYGPQTIGGIVDVITRPIPSSPAGSVDLAAGDFGYGKVHAHFGSSDERTGYLIERVHLRSDGFKELPTGADTGFLHNEWMFKGSYTPDPSSAEKNEIGLKLSYSDEISNETYLGLTDADFRRNPLARYGVSALDRMRWYRTGFALTHEYAPTAKISIKSMVYRNDFWRRWRKVNRFRDAELFDVLRDPDSAVNAVFHSVLTGQEDASESEAIMIGPNERSFVSQGIATKVELSAETGSAQHRIEYGARFHNDRVERRHSEDGFLYIAGQLIPDGTPTNVTTFNEASTDAFSFHLFDAVSFHALTVTPGVRLELMRSRFLDRADGSTAGGAQQVLLPGIGAYHGLTDELGVLAGVYRGMSPPPPEQDISPELSVNYEAGARFAQGAARAELIGYYNDYSNLTDICTSSSTCSDADLDRQFEAGEARIYGLEAFFEHEVPAGPVKLPLRAVYTLTFTEFLETFESSDPLFGNVTAGDEIPYVPRHQGFVSAGIETSLAGGYVSANYVSRMREVAGDEPLDEALSTDEQFTVDLGAHFRPLGWLKLYANVRNLFDEAYIVSRRPFGARPSAPRWTQVGVKADF